MQAAGRTAAPGVGAPSTFFPFIPLDGAAGGAFWPVDAVEGGVTSAPSAPVDSEVIIIPMVAASSSPATPPAGGTNGSRTNAGSVPPAAGGGGMLGGGNVGSPPPAGWLARIKEALLRLANWISPPIVRPLYNDTRTGDILYHGTSFEMLRRIVRSGGMMTEAKSYFASDAGFSYGYARSSARKTTTPGFVLQFPDAALDGHLKLGHFRPMASDDHRPPEILASYYVATEPIPLSAQTEESKQTILRWIAAQRDANPQDVSWSALLAEFTAALQPATPVPGTSDGPVRVPLLPMLGETPPNAPSTSDARPFNSPHSFPAPPTWVLPPFVQLGASPEALERAVSIAVEESRLLTEVALSPTYPTPSGTDDVGFPTFASPLQLFKWLMFHFNDTRTLNDVSGYFNYSPLGPLAFGVARAVERHRLRGLPPGPVDILEIGAGQRFVASGLHLIFGDQLRIHESAPVYASRRGGIDVELPPGSIDVAELPRDAFELSYSLFGNLYGDDQVAVLQKVTDSLRIGGEAFLMWKSTSTNRALATLVREHPEIFSAGGLDLAVIDMFDLDIAIKDKKNEHIFVVWARKRGTGIDIRDLFRQARSSLGKSGELGHTVRLSLDGPSIVIPAGSAFAFEPIVERMIQAFLDTSRIAPSDAYYYLTGTRLDAAIQPPQAQDLLLRHVMKRLPHSSLSMQLPLSVAVMAILHPILEVNGSGVSAPRLTTTITTAVHRGKLGH